MIWPLVSSHAGNAAFVPDGDCEFCMDGWGLSMVVVPPAATREALYGARTTLANIAVPEPFLQAAVSWIRISGLSTPQTVPVVAPVTDQPSLRSRS